MNDARRHVVHPPFREMVIVHQSLRILVRQETQHVDRDKRGIEYIREIAAFPVTTSRTTRLSGYNF
jgi:hypothetical protein